MKVVSTAVGALLLALAVGCGEDDSPNPETADYAAYGARSCATWFTYMGDEGRFVGAEWLLRKVMPADGTEGDGGSDSMTVEQFMDGITEACGQASMDTRLETVAENVFAANEDS